ncbi:C-C chemokine receptor type 3-like [Polypterus senegalus]|uniref:C-C chemokine receptor type 3-like n=1 Tax=Polypterus senegalus TaxID=55291 RepID=UPI00196603E4|nr:C-C chemokine receptor type 3-like [Polypterus senegalus]
MQNMDTAWDTTFSPDYSFNTLETENFSGPIVLLCEEDIQTTRLMATFTSGFFIMYSFLGLFGNGLVLLVVIKYEDLKKVTNIFILNLAISDMVFAFTLPFWAVYHVHHWIFGHVMCRLISGMYFTGFYSCIMFLTAMSFERYLTVVHAKAPKLKKRLWFAHLAAGIVWLFSLAGGIFEMIKSSALESFDGRILCEEHIQNNPELAIQLKNNMLNLVGYYLQNIFFFLVPLIIIIYCYCRILQTVRMCRTQKKFKVVKLIFAIVLAFFLCWAPYNLTLLLLSLRELDIGFLTECHIYKNLTYSLIICRNIACFHCCVNPLFYMCAQNFRQSLLNLLCRGSHSQCDRKVNQRSHESGECSKPATREGQTLSMDLI